MRIGTNRDLVCFPESQIASSIQQRFVRTGEISGLVVHAESLVTKEHSQSVQIKTRKRRNSGALSRFLNAELDVLTQRTVTQLSAWTTSE